MRDPQPAHDRSGLFRAPAGEQGSLVVIVMIFASVFLVLGLSLYWLIAGQTRSTETERTDVKAFNVAEAGVDAGMLTLKMSWPDGESEAETDEERVARNDDLRTNIREGTDGLHLPSRSAEGEFIEVFIYDNVDSEGDTTTVAYSDAPRWDSNADGKMFVDAWSNVDDDRHRILILAERQMWPVLLPGYAVLANVISSNGQGLEVNIEDGVAANVGTTVNPQGKGIDCGTGVTLLVGPTYNFDSVVTEGVKLALLGIAQSQGTYFEGTVGGKTAQARASQFMEDGLAGGKVVYVKSTTGGIEITGGSQIGTVAQPVVVVIDTPDGSENGWDIKGNAGFYGVVIVVGNSMLRGTSSIHGAIYSKGTLENKGNGQCGEIYYNQSIIYNINHMYVISVNIVPNSWEEYTLPRTETTVAGP